MKKLSNKSVSKKRIFYIILIVMDIFYWNLIVNIYVTTYTYIKINTFLFIQIYIFKY